MKPLPPAWATARGACRHQRVVGPREGNPVDDHQPAGHRRNVDALPQGHGAEQARVRFVGKLPHQRRHGRIPLAQDAHAQPGPHGLGGFLGRAPRGEQAQGAAAGGADQLLEFVQGLRGRSAAGFGQVPGDIEDALLRVVEGGADVDAGPARGAVPDQAQAAGGGFEG